MQTKRPRGRPRPLADPAKRATLVTLINAGVNRRVACNYVGVHFATLHRELERDPEFLDQVLKAEASHETGLINSIGRAGRKGKYWRAAAWTLERNYPSRFQRRPHDSISIPEFNLFLKYVARVVTDCVTNEEEVERIRDNFRDVPSLVRRRARKRRLRREMRELAEVDLPRRDARAAQAEARRRQAQEARRQEAAAQPQAREATCDPPQGSPSGAAAPQSPHTP